MESFLEADSPNPPCPPQLQDAGVRRSGRPSSLTYSFNSSLCGICRTVIGTPILYRHFKNDSRKLVLFWTTLFAYKPEQFETENKPYLVNDNPCLPRAINYFA